MPPISRLLVLAVMSAALQSENGYALPPVHTSGKVASAYRLNKPAQGSGTQSITNIFEVRADSYIWEPWFGIWQAAGAVSRSDTNSDRDSTADILTGDLQVNLFHRSRFPFTAFVGVRDNRVEISDLSQAASDIRTLRMGVIQQFQDLDNGVFYLGSFDRDEQQNLTLGEETVLNRLLLSASKTGQVHSFNGEFSASQSASSFANSEVQIGQTSGVYTYRPTASVTVSNYANATVTDSSSLLFSASSKSFAVGSQGEWRPDDGKLRLRGTIDLGHQESSNSEAEDEVLDTLAARVSARYELTDEMVVFSEVGAAQRETTEDADTTTFQSLSATYTSTPIDWNRFLYSWTAGAGIANQTSSAGSNTFSQTASLGHTVTRSWLPDLGGLVPIVFSAGQDGQVLNDTGEDPELRITHRATASATQATDAGTSYAQISAFDIRNFGRTASGAFSLTAAASHNRRISRYRGFELTATYSYNMSTNGNDAVQSDNAALETRYRDSRFFDVNRLEFESRLRASFSNLYATTESDLLIDFEWDNRLRYRIGLLEIDTRAAMTQTDSNRNFLFLLGLTRRF